MHTAPGARNYAAKVVARYETHGGYVWAGVCSDGGLLCAKCIRSEWPQIAYAEVHQLDDDWRIIGLTNSGESEETEQCAHCNSVLWSTSD